MNQWAANNTATAEAGNIATATRGQIAQTGWQRFVCRLLHVPLYAVCVGLMKHKAGYKFKDLDAVRRRFAEIAAASDTPLLVCANHLTFIDSALMIWAFGSNSYYLKNFSRFSWNLPAGDFFGKRLLYRFIAAISKCIFIHRDGSKEHKDSVLTVCMHLLRAGEVVTVFPEGKRSRSGRFDTEKLTYGTGKMIAQLGRCRVLCVYLRGDKQDTYTNYPPSGSTFHVDMDLLEVAPRQGRGRDAYKEIVDRIGTSIKGMEDRYFAER